VITCSTDLGTDRRTEMEHKEVYLIRTSSPVTGWPIWIVFDDEHVVRGVIGESRYDVMRRYSEKSGFPVKEVTRYDGVLRMAEVATAIMAAKPSIRRQ